jgi:hypothetical protein
MKQYLTIVGSMVAALATFASPVLGSSQQRLRGGGKPLKKKEHYSASDNDVPTPRQHRVLEALPGGTPSIVKGNLGNLGVDPKSAGRE